MREGKNMKRIRKALAILLTLCALLACVPAGADNYIDMGGVIPDRNAYGGAWRDAFQQILSNHAAAIRRYQNRVIQCNINGKNYVIPCLPAALQDLNSSGIPELIFMEEADGGARGDLYIYGRSGSSTRCILYVPGITRLDYDDFLGFDIFLSSAGGKTLVVEHYEFETPWILQFRMNSKNRYELLNYYTVEADNSGEEDDKFYQNGKQISADAYFAARQALEQGRVRDISSYMRPDYSAYGFDLTWEAAVKELQGAASQKNSPSNQSGNEAIYGLAIKKLATRTGPGTTYAEGGSYDVKGQYIQVLAKAYDKRNEIWWVKCVIPYRGKNKVLWTGYMRFDHSTLPLDRIPEEF